MTRANRPGPRGTSCLTCKQRHKKCDQQSPVCERCEKGGFECLGYGHNSDTRFRGYRRTRLLLPGEPESGAGSASVRLLNELLPEDVSSGGSSEDSAPVPKLSNLAHAEMEGASILRPSNLEIDSNLKDQLPTCTRPTLQLTDGPMSTFRKVTGFYVQLSNYSFDPLKTLLTNPSFDDYLVAQHGKFMEQWYFKPANIQKQVFQRGVVSHLQSSLAGFSRWIALIGMGICESFITGDTSQNQLHSVWMAYIENFLRRELSCDTTSYESHNQRRDWVHVSLLRTLVTHGSNIYQVLRNLTPTFLQLTFSDPTLWPRESNPEYVPLLNILAFGSHEVAYFALIDCTCAMAFGLPQQVEYDTTLYTLPGTTPWHQWAHGSPAEFQVVLADINACRDRSPNARDWKDIERWLLAWQPRPGECAFTDSWMTIAWYAVQESWRLALLAYLYLAVCRASSDDPRVQNCVKQLLQVIGTVKKRQSSSSEVSFLVQYLIAGICARSEAHRKLVRDKLEKPEEPKLWVMRGSDFIAVLDHLWHGAAAGGRPVRWSDYVHSREAVLPIVL